MRRTEWILCAWPGLARIWLRGDWYALLGATAFALVLNAALICTFVWPDLVSPTIRTAAWGLVAVTWLVTGAFSARRLSAGQKSQPENLDDHLLIKAQTEYLQGDWYEAEKSLLLMLQEQPLDADARIMLASLYRHTKRPDLARRELKRLRQQEPTGKWQMEIEHELQRLDRSEEVDDVNAQAA